jgi:hypothetical protein
MRDPKGRPGGDGAKGTENTETDRFDDSTRKSEADGHYEVRAGRAEKGSRVGGQEGTQLSMVSIAP